MYVPWVELLCNGNKMETKYIIEARESGAWPPHWDRPNWLHVPCNFSSSAPCSHPCTLSTSVVGIGTYEYQEQGLISISLNHYWTRTFTSQKTTAWCSPLMKNSSTKMQTSLVVQPSTRQWTGRRKVPSVNPDDHFESWLSDFHFTLTATTME